MHDMHYNHYENENAKIVLNPKFSFFGAKSVLIGNPQVELETSIRELGRCCFLQDLRNLGFGCCFRSSPPPMSQPLLSRFTISAGSDAQCKKEGLGLSAADKVSAQSVNW